MRVAAMTRRRRLGMRRLLSRKPKALYVVTTYCELMGWLGGPGERAVSMGHAGRVRGTFDRTIQDRSINSIH